MAGSKIARLLQRSDAAIAQHDWGRLLSLAAAVLALDPDHTEATGLRELALRRIAEHGTADATDGHAGALPGTGRGEAATKEATGGQHAAHPVLVGRHSEWQVLRASLDAARTGKTRMVTVGGEPGGGKSHLITTFAMDAAAGGALCVWGHSHERTATPPLWPVAQCVRELHESGIVDAPEVENGPLTALLDEQPSLPAGDRPEAAHQLVRFQLFAAMQRYLSAASASQTLVLVFEDIHWADSDTLEWLEYTAVELRAARVLLIVTFRDVGVPPDHPLHRTLGALSRTGAARHIALEPLSDADSRLLVTRTVTRPISDELVLRITADAAGNPLYLRELSRAIGDSPDQLDQPGQGLPTTLRATIAHRLSHLTPVCRELLTVASVLGRHFWFELLTGIAGLGSPGRQGRLLDEAERHGLVAAVPGQPGLLRFTHPLIQAALYEDLPSAVRARVHARIAEARESEPVFDAAPRAAELAYHFGEAIPELGLDRFVPHALAAARQALAMGSPSEAARWCERVLAHGSDRLAPRIAAEAHAGLILSGSGSSDDLQAAFDLFESLGAYDEAVQVAATPRYYGYDHRAEHAAAINARALHLAKRPADRVRLLCAHAVNLWSSNRWPEADAAITAARALAADIGDRHLELVIRYPFPYYAIQLELWPLEQLIADLRQARSCEDVLLELRVCNYMAELAARTAERAAFLARLPDTLALTRRVGPHLANITLITAARALVVGGSWVWFQRLEGELANRNSDDITLATIRRTLCEEQGQVDAATLTRAEQASAASPSMAYNAVILAVYALRAGSRAAATTARTLGQRLASAGSLPNLAGPAATTLGLCAAAAGDRAAARRRYREICALHDYQTTTWFIGVEHTVGLVAAAAGLSATARRHLRRAIAHHRKFDQPVLRGWAQQDLAELLLATGGACAADEAQQLLEDVRAVATATGLTPLAMRAAAVMSGATDQDTTEALAGLTGRETDVVRLVALGYSNKTIAAELGISIKTVATHLSSIYRKAGVPNRAAATRFAVDVGLVPAHPSAQSSAQSSVPAADQ